MENAIWLLTEALVKNLALSLDALQSNIGLNVIYMALYIIILAIKTTAARAKASAAVFLCVGLSYSPLFYILNEVQYYALLSIIYSITARSITNERGKAACSIMAVFELAMVIDSGVANGDETYLFSNYETITTIIHCCIISAFVRWDLSIWRDSLARAARGLRSILRSGSGKAFVCYHYYTGKD